MKKTYLSLVFGILFLFGTGFFLGIGSLWYLNTDHARIGILNALNQHISGSVSIQRHRFSFLSGRIDIWDLRIIDFFQEEAAQCDHLSLSISWGQLLQGKLFVRSASIEKPRFKVSVLPDGTLNFSGIFSEPAPAPTTSDEQSGLFLPLSLVDVTLKDVKLSYEDSKENLYICLENMDADLSADFLNQAGKTHIRIGSGHISSPFFHSEFGPVSFEGNLADGHILPLHLSLSSPGLNTDISGMISEVWQTPQLSLYVNVDGSLSALNQGLDLNTPILGLVQASGTISGTLDNPDASLNLTCKQAMISGYSLPRLQMSANLKDRILTLDSLTEPETGSVMRISGSADLKQALPTGVFGIADTRSVVSANMHIGLDSVNLSDFHPAATGIVTGNLLLQVKGTLNQLQNADIALDIQAGQVSLHPSASPVNMKINGQGMWDSDRFLLHHLTAQAGTTRLTAKGLLINDLLASNHKINAEIICQSDNLSSSLSPLGIQGISGKFRAQANLSGTMKAPSSSFKLKGSELGYQEIQLGALDLDADLEPSGALRISKLSIKNQGSELTAKGVIPILSDKDADSGIPFSFTAAFRQVEPDHFMRSAILQAKIDGNCALEGTKNSLSGSLQIQAKDMKIETVRLGNVTGDFQLSSGAITIQRLFLKNRRSRADFNGRIQVFQPGSRSFYGSPPFHLSGSGTQLFAEDFVDFMKGKFSLAAEMEGIPEQVRGAASLESEHLSTGFQNLSTVQLAASLMNNKLSISKLHATVAPGESLEASGWFAMDKTFQFDLKTDVIDIRHVDAFSGIAPAAEGKMHVNFSGNGSLDHPVIHGQVVLNPFRFHETNWDNARFQMDVSDHLARINIQSPISGSVSYHLQTREYTAGLVFTQMELSPFFQSADLTGIGGRISGKLTGSGNLDFLKTLKADAAISDLLVTAKGHPIIEGQNLNLGIENEAIIIPQNRLAIFQEGTLDIGGEARPGRALSLRLNADIPITAARHFNDGLSDFRGNLIIVALMKGSWFHPEIEALVDFRNAGLTLDKSSLDIHDVNGRMHITPKAIDIENLEGFLDSGRLTVNGKAELDAFRIQAMDFRMHASEIPFKIADTLDAKLNAGLTLQGNAQAPLIQGEIVVLEGLYYKNVNLNPLKSVLRRERSFQPRQEVVFPAVIQNSLLDIRIPPRNLFVVDNNLAQLKLSPDMHITGTLQRPIIQGRTRVDSGNLQYQSTTFSVKKGFIDFTNPYTLESVLDIQSQAAIQNWTVFLDISGPLDKLNLKLSSSPFLDDSDLLSLLITGKTARASIHKNSGNSGSSTKMLADLLSASIGSNLKKASGLDILEVDSTGENRYGSDDQRIGRAYGSPVNLTGENRYGNDDPLKVTFGKIISPQITLKYAVETKGGVTFQRTITEYMLIENILLSGFQDSRGGIGGEVKYRHEFR